MKKWILLTVLLVVPLVAVAEEKAAWQRNYEHGLQLIAQGQWEEATSFLKMAVADRPISEVTANLEYLPYLQLGICYDHLGKSALAADFLELEDSLPAVSQSRGGRVLMKEYRQKIASQTAKLPAHPAVDEKAIRDFVKKPYVLSDTQVGQLKEEIRVQCNLPRAQERSYPWYYHYELGLALESRKDWQRALDSFLGALDLRERPQRLTRIYGMWFRDYYPYYNIGLAHYEMGNWKCALTSFRLSRIFEDLPKSSAEYLRLQEMEAKAEQNLAEVPSRP